MKGNKQRVVALGLLTTLLVAGCAGGGAKPGNTENKPGAPEVAQPESKTPKAGGTLRVALSANPRNIDPRLQWDSTSQMTLINMVDRLFTVAEDFSYRPLLAESWSGSPDGKSYTFKLRAGATFHDGTPVTAEAIKQNILWAADPDHKSPQVTMWDALEGVETPDAQTVVINLKSPVSEPSFMANMLDSPWPISGQQIMQNGDKAISNPIGAGPFKFVSYTGDDQVVMERYDQYWGGKPYLDKIVYRVIPDAATRRVEMEAGTIDVLMDVAAKDVEAYKAKGLNVIVGPANTNGMISLNVATPALQELAVRQAISHAINREAIVQKIFYGYVTPATTYMHPQNVNYAKDIPGYTYDLAKAKALLNDAGWKEGPDGIRVKDGKRLELTIGSRNHDTWNIMSQVMQEQLKAVGIATKINTTDTTAFYDSVRGGTYDIAYWSLNASGWHGLDHPNLRSTDWGNIAHLAKSSAELQQVQSTIDGLIDGFNSALKADERTKFAHDLQKIVNEQAITVPLWFEDRIYVMQPYVKGFEAPTVVRTILFDKAWLDK